MSSTEDRGDGQLPIVNRQWPRVRLGEMCSLVNGDAYKSEDWSKSGVPIIRIQNLNDSSKPFNHWAGDLEDRVVVRDGDVLLAWSGTPGTSFGTHLWERGLGVLNQHIFRVDLDPSRLEPAWAVFAINEQLNQLIDRAHGGVGLRHVTRGECDSLRILVPPLPEQRRIAARLKEQLAAVEQARRAAQAQLEEVGKLPAALLRDAFQSPDARRWPRVRLGDHATKIGSGVTPRGGQMAYVAAGIPLIRSQNVRMNGFTNEGLVFITAAQDAQMTGTRVEPGDVLLNITGASIGRVCVVPDWVCPANVNQHVCIIRLKPTLAPEWLAYFISQPLSQSQIFSSQAGATRQALTKALIEQFIVPAPPLPEQRRIAGRLRERLAAVEEARRAAQAQLSDLAALPDALLREAFGGAG